MDLKKIKRGLPVIVEDRNNLIAGVVFLIDEAGGEIGVKIGEEVRSFPAVKIHQNFRQQNGFQPRFSPPYQRQTNLQQKMGGFIVAIANENVSLSSVKEVAQELKNARITTEENKVQEVLEALYVARR